MHPLVITFAAGGRLYRESDRASDMPIYRNGPPGTFILFPGLRVSLPTDLIVLADENNGQVRVGFGGMRFDGVQGGRLTFTRVQDLRAEEELSPDRSWTMTLEPGWVAAVEVDGVTTWADGVTKPSGS